MCLVHSSTPNIAIEMKLYAYLGLVHSLIYQEASSRGRREPVGRLVGSHAIQSRVYYEKQVFYKSIPQAKDGFKITLNRGPGPRK